MRWQENQIPSASTLQSSNLLSHGMLPLLVDGNLSVGHGLNKSSSCEAISLRKLKSATIMKIVPGSRL
uniref:Uncharacterized protein n=1 Tax=Arundo donax TaxID=35708 RepID=A0A0A9GTA5_ARUDO